MVDIHYAEKSENGYLSNNSINLSTFNWKPYALNEPKLVKLYEQLRKTHGNRLLPK